MFADYFQSVYESDNNITPTSFDFNNPLSTASVSVNIDIPYITYEDILEGLKEVSNCVGDDGIPPFVLPKLSSLIDPLVLLFNGSLKSGIFPTIWKVSHILPIFKNGKRADITNYRGISILSGIPKLYEKIVTKYLQFNVNHLISSNQHGFVKQRSTTTNLCELVMFGLNAFEVGAQFDVIYLDFSKAFDRINHEILLRKLWNLGFSNLLVQWMGSYLMGRQQYVLLNGHRSKLISVQSGVPQGSHLGPLLFIIFINDIVDKVKYAELLLYADDLKLYRIIKDISDAFLLQSDLNSLAEWCTDNKLNLNVKKCKAMSFYKMRSPIFQVYSLAGDFLERVNKMNDLGIIFTFNLNFNCHIESIVSKCNAVLGLITRMTSDFKNMKAINTLYTTLVRSICEYGVLIWNSPTQTSTTRIESIQKRYLRYYFKKIHWPYNPSLLYWENMKLLPPYSERCRIAGVENLKSRRDVLCAQFIGDLISSRIDSPYLLSQININVPARNLRQYNFIYLEPHKTAYGTFAPLKYAADLFNRYYDCFDFNLSKNVFKNNLKNFNL